MGGHQRRSRAMGQYFVDGIDCESKKWSGLGQTNGRSPTSTIAVWRNKVGSCRSGERSWRKRVFRDFSSFADRSTGRRRGVPNTYTNNIYADVVELADTPDLGSGGLRREGSSPFFRTIFRPCKSLYVRFRMYMFMKIYKKKRSGPYGSLLFCQFQAGRIVSRNSWPSPAFWASFTISSQATVCGL